MEQGPSSEADGHSAGQEIPRLLWNPKVNFCSQEPATGAYSQPVEFIHNFPQYFTKIYSNIILPSTPTSSEWSPSPSGFVTKILNVFLTSPICAIYLLL
jgi:hypothetical protein